MQLDNHVIGQTIRKLRIARGLSQEVLSGLSDIARTHLSMIETGQKMPNLETIWKLADAFDLCPSELVRKIEDTIAESSKEGHA